LAGLGGGSEGGCAACVGALGGVGGAPLRSLGGGVRGGELCVGGEGVGSLWAGGGGGVWGGWAGGCWGGWGVGLWGGVWRGGGGVVGSVPLQGFPSVSFAPFYGTCHHLLSWLRVLAILVSLKPPFFGVFPPQPRVASAFVFFLMTSTFFFVASLPGAASMR